MEYLLRGVRDTAAQAADTARELIILFEEDHAVIQTLGRSSASAFRVHDLLQRRPLITIQAASKELKLSLPTVGKALDRLAEVGIVRERLADSVAASLRIANISTFWIVAPSRWLGAQCPPKRLLAMSRLAMSRWFRPSTLIRGGAQFRNSGAGAVPML
ncbi:winged helix-turn-helix domain-containing protein [Bradyrhizobium oligotrophicum]|uniref:winged helix-turn-helix domain-containing protein n=1 Tax=Bradyrhizobium oligotrophicum TaxID=44255 RepID=UPI003EB9E634